MLNVLTQLIETARTEAVRCQTDMDVRRAGGDLFVIESGAAVFGPLDEQYGQVPDPVMWSTAEDDGQPAHDVAFAVLARGGLLPDVPPVQYDDAIERCAKWAS
jgi:hypothetical protein